MFPIAFSLRGMGEASEADSLMRVFEEQIRLSLKEFAPSVESQIRLTSAELAADWYDKAAAWMDKTRPYDREFSRLRREAAELLGIDESPREEKEKPSTEN